MVENVFKLLKIIFFCTFLTQGEGVSTNRFLGLNRISGRPPPNHKKMYTTLY